MSISPKAKFFSQGKKRNGVLSFIYHILIVQRKTKIAETKCTITDLDTEKKGFLNVQNKNFKNYNASKLLFNNVSVSWLQFRKISGARISLL